jgi:hypothetical protein
MTSPISYKPPLWKTHPARYRPPLMELGVASLGRGIGRTSALLIESLKMAVELFAMLYEFGHEFMKRIEKEWFDACAELASSSSLFYDEPIEDSDDRQVEIIFIERISIADQLRLLYSRRNDMIARIYRCGIGKHGPWLLRLIFRDKLLPGPLLRWLLIHQASYFFTRYNFFYVPDPKKAPWPLRVVLQ